MRYPPCWLICLLLLCTGPAVAADGTRIVLVRHAEKADDDVRDPGLSETGQRRALALAERLAAEPPAAIYATPYRRTQLSALPTAQQQGLRITVRGASESAADFAALLRRRHRGQRVLVVGHSNTIPALAEALSGTVVAPMAEHEYDRLLIVTLRDTQATQLHSERLLIEPEASADAVDTGTTATNVDR